MTKSCNWSKTELYVRPVILVAEDAVNQSRLHTQCGACARPDMTSAQCTCLCQVGYNPICLYMTLEGGKPTVPMIREDAHPCHLHRTGACLLSTAEDLANTMFCLGPCVLNFTLSCCTYLNNRQFPNCSQSRPTLWLCSPTSHS